MKRNDLIIFYITHIVFINLVFIHQSIAGDGMIIVLEAPIFSKPDIKSQVVQYFKKGEEVYIHPKEFNRNDLLSASNFNPEPQSFAEDKKRYDEEFKDKLFTEKDINEQNNNIIEYKLFYTTVDNLGRNAYILKEHVSLNFNDDRESSSNILTKDNTDYRPTKELSDEYPFLKTGENRGQFQLGFSKSFRQSYPYDEKVNDQGLGIETEFNFNWARDVDWDESKKLFFGGNILIGFHENNFTLENFTASEKVFRVGLGPYLSYDMWRDKEYRFSISIALPINLVNSKDINFKVLNTNTRIDSQYQAFNIEPHIGSSFQIKNMFNGMDFILGFNVISVLPFSYQLIESSSETNVIPSSFRKEVVNESFQLISNFFIGFQTVH